MKREPTPSQRLWAEVFGLVGIPGLDEKKVLALVGSLPQREKLAVRLRFGFEGRPLSLDRIGRRLPRVDGGTGVSREIVRRELGKALRRLGRADYRQKWEEARR